MPLIKPEDFTTKPKHLKDRGKDYVSVYAQDPQAHLSSVATGMKMEHNRLGTWTTGLIPPGVSAYVRENGREIPCGHILFGWRNMRHYAVTQRYVDEKLLPNSVPAKS